MHRGVHIHANANYYLHIHANANYYHIHANANYYNAMHVYYCEYSN